jgi:6-phosphofructokinase 1
MVVEVMGRHAGWISAYAGIASGANLILVPEQPFDVEDVCNFLKKRHNDKRTTSIIVVGEGCILKNHSTSNASETDDFGHIRLGGIGETLAREIEKRVGIETRAVVLGHVVRGGAPSAYDRILATRLGFAAVQAVNEQDFGVMVCLRANKMSRIPLTDILGKMKNLDEETISLMNDFRG